MTARVLVLILQPVIVILLLIVNTLGKPPIGAAFTKASLIFRAISNRSSCSGLVSKLPPPLSMACLNTAGIWSGRFSTDKVTPAMKYQECCGRCGHERIEERSAGETTAGNVTGDMELGAVQLTDVLRIRVRINYRQHCSLEISYCLHFNFHSCATLIRGTCTP